MTKSQRRRYYLHSRVRKVFKLNARKRTVYIPYNKMPEGLTQKHVNSLIEFGYGIQLEIV